MKSNTTDTSWFAVYRSVKDFWETVIVGDLGSAVSTSGLSKTHVATAFPPSIDDVYIAGSSLYIDGPGKILGQGGWKILRSGGTFKQPLTGIVKFDQDDIPRYMTAGTFEGIVSHEIGHVLGIGTLWTSNNLHTSGSDRYRGAKGNAEWKAMGCTASTDYLPIEQDIATSNNAHWDELCLRTELMTGRYSLGSKLSRLTIASMEDMGYRVSYAGASSFTTCDLSSDALCKRYCQNAGTGCPATRSLRKAPTEKKEKPRLSQAGHDNVVKYAKASLQKEPPEERNQVGRSLEVLYEENGEVYEVHVMENDLGELTSSSHSIII
jgi:hypothetical protein